MLADYYTKALQGSLYNIFRNVIMGYDDISIILDFLKSKIEEHVGKYPNNETISTVKNTNNEQNISYGKSNHKYK